jgi:hypothetical protein
LSHSGSPCLLFLMGSEWSVCQGSLVVMSHFPFAVFKISPWLCINHFDLMGLGIDLCIRSVWSLPALEFIKDSVFSSNLSIFQPLCHGISFPAASLFLCFHCNYIHCSGVTHCHWALFFVFSLGGIISTFFKFTYFFCWSNLLLNCSSEKLHFRYFLALEINYFPSSSKYFPFTVTLCVM